MNSLFYLEINLIGMVILCLLVRNRNRTVGATMERRAFNRMLYSTMLMLVVDSVTWMMNGQSFTGAREVGYLASSLYFFLNCLVPFMWLAYTAVYFNMHSLLLGRHKLLTYLPLWLNTALVISNLKHHQCFYVDQNNQYHRGPWFFLLVALPFVYLLFPAVVSLMRIKSAENKLERNRCVSILLFLAFPLAGSLIQVLFFGVSMIWICVVLALLQIFIRVQNDQISTDGLTGLNNRYQFNRYLLRTFSVPETRGHYALIMIDVDRFKQINDTYGHICGDRALAQVADILKKSCAGTSAFLSRYGGDEFTVICETQVVEELVQRIHETAQQFNQAQKEGYEISLSTGYALYADVQARTMDDLVILADQAMYKQKAARHNS